MDRRLKKIICFAALLALVNSTLGFTLYGPNSGWMITRLGFGPDANDGGPVNIGEEYRWNVPEVTYGFSPSFLNYFGSRGEIEVNKGVAIFNGLPTASNIDPNNYPLKSARVNYRASELQLLDLKSTTMGLLINHMGLTDPRQWVNTLRKRWEVTVGGTTITNYMVIRRNFDPFVYEPSPVINGDLYTYTDILETDDASFLVNSPADPLSFGNIPVTALIPGSGTFWTGLTRDDAAGLKYIYRQNNVNMEALPLGSTNFTAGTGQNVIGSGSFGNSPWNTPFVFTNQPAGGGQQQPDQGFGIQTNLVDIGLRRGVGKVRFTQVEFDNLLGFFRPATVVYQDRVISTNTLTAVVNQTVGREITQPDILFHSADLQGAGDSDTTDATMVEITPEIGTKAGAGGDGSYRYIDAFQFTNVGTSEGRTPDGPGIIQGPIIFSFSNVGERLFNSQPNFLSEINAFSNPQWGTFDGTTNAPIVYPVGRFIEDIEQRAAGNF